MDQFLKKFFYFSIGPIGGALISILTVPVTTYFISPQEFGKAGVFTISYGFLLTLSYLGMDQAYSREYHYTENKSRLLLNAISVPILTGLFIFFFLLIFRQNISYWLFNDENYTYLVVWLGLAVLFGIFERFLLMTIRMEEKAMEYSLFSIALKTIVLFTTIGLILTGMRSFKLIVYATLIGQIAGDSYLIWRYRTILKAFKRSALSTKFIKSLVLFGFPLLISVSLNYFLNVASLLFLRYHGFFHELGIYSAGQKLANVLTIIQLAFTSFWVPLSYRWYKEERAFRNFQFVSDFLLLLATIGFFILTLSKRFVVFLLSADYEQATFIICFLALIPILYTLSETTTLGIVFSKKSYLNIYVSLFSIITTSILSVFLVPSWKEKGAALSIALGYVIFFVIRTYYSRKNGFEIKINKHMIQVILLVIVSFINMSSKDYIPMITLCLFLVSLILQRGTLKQVLEIRSNPSNYHLS